VLLVLFLLLIGRGMMITANASTMFARLVAGAVTLMFFTEAFVNMGMVSGVLPVVGVPLPFVSYGGTGAHFALHRPRSSHERASASQARQHVVPTTPPPASPPSARRWSGLAVPSAPSARGHVRAQSASQAAGRSWLSQAASSARPSE
jgi:hypothetical protein